MGHVTRTSRIERSPAAVVETAPIIPPRLRSVAVIMRMSSSSAETLWLRRTFSMVKPPSASPVTPPTKLLPLMLKWVEVVVTPEISTRLPVLTAPNRPPTFLPPLTSIPRSMSLAVTLPETTRPIRPPILLPSPSWPRLPDRVMPDRVWVPVERPATTPASRHMPLTITPRKLTSWTDAWPRSSRNRPKHASDSSRPEPL